MLKPSDVTGTIVTALRSIPELVAEMGSADRIYDHVFLSGLEGSKARAVGMMESPSILVAYLAMLAGNFDGSSVWKHQIEVHFRPKNAAMGEVDHVTGPSTPALSAPDIWHLAFNSPVLGTTRNIRELSLLSGSLFPMDTQGGLMSRVDELGMDFWVATVTFTEWGDQ